MTQLFSLKNLKKALKDPLWALIFLSWWVRGFSQAGEDFILNWLIKKDKGIYVDVWANHPIHGNNTYFFYKKWWTGINIEPNKKLHKKFLIKRRNDINLQVAIGNNSKEMVFFVFDENSMSTWDLETVNRYENVWHKVVDKYAVPVLTLKEVFNKYLHNKKIDILSIDVEWLDMEVLQSNDWTKYRPSYVVVETVKYWSNWPQSWTKENNIFDPYMKSIGYEIIAETWINTIYCLTSING